MKRRISEIEQSNEIASLAIYRTKANIRRLRLEHAILIERLEQRALEFPEDEEELLLMNEDIPIPPTPTLLTDSLSAQVPKLSRNGVTKGAVKKGMKGVKLKDAENGSSGVTFTVKTPKVRDPDLPKRPTNAYLIFCELEKERVRTKLEEKGTPAPGDLGKALIEEWGRLTMDDKAPFYKLYEEDKLRYNREIEAYNKKKNIVPEEPPAKKVKRKMKPKAEGTVKIEDETKENAVEIGADQGEKKENIEEADASKEIEAEAENENENENYHEHDNEIETHSDLNSAEETLKKENVASNQLTDVAMDTGDSAATEQ